MKGKLKIRWHALNPSTQETEDVTGFSLSNYISAEEACDWTGKRVAEMGSQERKRKKTKMVADVSQCGCKQPQVVMRS